MPHTHIAMFRCREGIEIARIEAMLKLVRDIKVHIPGILDIRCGQNQHRNNKGYTHCITVVGLDAETLDIYRKHPLHEPIVAEYGAIVEESVACDFIDDSK